MIGPRQFIRRKPPHDRVPDIADQVRRAIAEDGSIAVYDETKSGSVLVFSALRSGPATVVRTPAGRVLAVTVDPFIGLLDAFMLLDADAPPMPCTQEHRRRRCSKTSARRPSKEDRAP